MPDDLAHLDATAQADLVRRGAASPAELVDAAITRIGTVDAELNSVVTERFERARAEAADPAGLPDGPFRGVPFLLKDLGCPMAGEPAHEGMQALKDAGYTASADSHLARRFRSAGLVVLGRANTPELGIMPTTEPASYGPTRNPWDVARTPGGSSGGSAAAVAAGLVPAAHASDGGGSIRIPASCCGLVGLKPSRGRVSVGPGSGELVSFLSVQFAVTRSVRDAAALLDVAAGPEVGDPVVAPAPEAPFAELATQAPPPLRIGVMTTHPATGGAVDPECVAAVEATAVALEELGHHVGPDHPPALDEPDRANAFAAVWSVNAARNLAVWGATLGRELGADDVEPLTWALAERGAAISAVEYLTSVAEMQAWSRRVTQWWADGSDLLLTATLGEPPPELGVLSTPEQPFAGFARAATFVPYTMHFNVTGQPAISLPLHWTAGGLPVGVHLVAAYGREDRLLQVAAQLETARPWSDRVPSVHA